MKNKKNPETFGSRWRYVWVLFALVFSVSVAAQKTVVKGNILDKDNLPIIGANILEKGTSNGTISDVDAEHKDGKHGNSTQHDQCHLHIYHKHKNNNKQQIKCFQHDIDQSV